MMRLRSKARRELVCQQAVELVTDYLDGALTRSDRRRFEKHLAGCPHCTEYLAQIRATIAITGRITAEDLTDQMRADFVDLYRSWQRDRDFDPTDGDMP
jgi:anti-sigma factor RsiW